MARYVTIKENRDFSRIYRKGNSFVSPVLVTYVIKRRGDKPRYGITTGKDQYYIVWLDDDSMIALAANGKDVKELDRILDETWDYIDDKAVDLTSDTLHVKGKLVNMSVDEKKFYQESLDYIGVTEDERDIHYYKIDCTDSRLFLILMVVVLCGLGLLLIILFVNHRRAMRRAIEAADYTFDKPVSEADRLSGFYEEPKQ